MPGTAIFQSPNHETEPFTGTYEDDHPLLQTCTLNNNVCATITDPMRFALSTARDAPAFDPSTANTSWISTRGRIT